MLPILLFISIISSFIYWLLSRIYISTNVYIIAFFKLFSIISLIPLLKSEIYPVTLFIYALGDVALLFDMRVSMFLFDISHLLYILPFFCTFLSVTDLLYLIPLDIFIMFQIEQYFPRGPMFRIHITVLGALLYYAVANRDYIVLCHIVSDIMIGLKLFHYLTWPIYYIGMVVIALSH